MKRLFFLFLFCSACAVPWNNPYPQAFLEENAFFSAFIDRPKHLDPAQAYDEISLIFVAQIYEAPLQYHYLKRPYALEPNLLKKMPEIRFLNEKGEVLPPDAKEVFQTRYRLIFRDDLFFQPHPAFSKTPWNAEKKPADFKENTTRKVTADDFIYAIKRLGDPIVASPIAPVMEEHIVGFKEFTQNLKNFKKNKGLPWNSKDFVIEGVKKINDSTVDIFILGKYPQFLYWLAMPFFAPIPEEEKAFFSPPEMAKNNLSLDSWPIGTGAYRLLENSPQSRIVLIKNPNFKKETYPCVGERGDEEKGFLKDCGKALPQIEKLIFSREKEAIPYWNRFLQGFYDASGISNDQFDSAIQMDVGRIDLSPALKEKEIQFSESVQSAVFYMGVNMEDPILGGLEEKKVALRQALNIALNVEEFIAIFLNGRAIAAQSPIPPGIFGFDEKEFNPYLYDSLGKRKSVEEAKLLLKKAGYPNGRDEKTGEPLVLYLDTTTNGMGEKSRLDWLIRQFKQIDVQLIVRATDFNRFQNKLRQGASQLFYIGWNADYPDPENFLFLLDSNNTVKKGGDNYTQYHNPQFDVLYKKLRAMENTDERQNLLKAVKKIVQHDSPWIFALHPKVYALNHFWLKNRKASGVINNGLKYQRVEFQKRHQKQKEWNHPKLFPFFILLGFFFFLIDGFFYLQKQTHAQKA